MESGKERKDGIPKSYTESCPGLQLVHLGAQVRNGLGDGTAQLVQLKLAAESVKTTFI